MNASVCPTCHYLLSSRERAGEKCPKCAATLPELPKVRTLSDRKFASRGDLLNSRSFVWRASLICTALAMVALTSGCVSLQFQELLVFANGWEMINMLLSVLVLIGSAVAGFFGLSGSIRGGWTDGVMLSTIGLILSGVQLVYWVVSIFGRFAT